MDTDFSTHSVSTGITLICPEEAPRFIKTQTPIHILWLPPACSTTSQHFHLPPCYETHELTINISLNTANLNVINISSPEFRIWQHLEDHWNETQLHHLSQTYSQHFLGAWKSSVPGIDKRKKIILQNIWAKQESALQTPIDQFHKHLISSNRPITPFMSTDESIDDTASIWTLFLIQASM